MRNLNLLLSYRVLFFFFFLLRSFFFFLLRSFLSLKPHIPSTSIYCDNESTIQIGHNDAFRENILRLTATSSNIIFAMASFLFRVCLLQINFRPNFYQISAGTSSSYLQTQDVFIITTLSLMGMFQYILFY